MDQIFKKYIHKVLNPDEYLKLSEFLTDEKNEEVIYRLMKPLWDTDIQQDSDKIEPNPELRNKIKYAILIEDRDNNKRNLIRSNFFLRIASILIIGLLITSVFFANKSTPKEFTSQLQNIIAPYGAKTSFKLPDGSIVWLNSGSSVSYKSNFENGRIVNLRGEAFFDVVKNATPFRVMTQFGDVEAKGTSFNVNAYADENFQTTLLTGVVVVTDRLTGGSVSLQPGQQALNVGKELKVNDVETDMFSSWKDGKLIFRNEYLPMVTKRLERWYNVKIDLAKDKRLSDISYTGVLEMESFSEVLQLLKVTAPIDYRYDEQTRTIKIIYKKTI